MVLYPRREQLVRALHIASIEDMSGSRVGQQQGWHAFCMHALAGSRQRADDAWHMVGCTSMQPKHGTSARTPQRRNTRPVLRSCARTAAPSADVAKAYKNLDELLAQLRSSFYTGAATAGAGAGAGAAKGGQAEAAQSGRLRADASEEAAGPRPPPPPAYEEFDDGLGVHSRLP